MVLFFFYELKELVWAVVSDTLNMVVRCVEKILGAFEKNFDEEMVEYSISSPPFILKKVVRSAISWLRVRLVCRMIPKLIPIDSLGPEEHPQYASHVL